MNIFFNYFYLSDQSRLKHTRNRVRQSICFRWQTGDFVQGGNESCAEAMSCVLLLKCKVGGERSSERCRYSNLALPSSLLILCGPCENIGSDVAQTDCSLPCCKMWHSRLIPGPAIHCYLSGRCFVVGSM